MRDPRTLPYIGWKLSQEKNDWYKKELTKNGLAIIQPTAELQSDLIWFGIFVVFIVERTLMSP